MSYQEDAEYFDHRRQLVENERERSTGMVTDTSKYPWVEGTSVKVFLNDQSGFSGYEPEHKLELVWEGTLQEPDLDLVWAMFNRGSDKFVGDVRYPHRSLSVGDVVELDGTRHAAEGVGWKELPAEETPGSCSLETGSCVTTGLGLAAKVAALGKGVTPSR